MNFQNTKNLIFDLGGVIINIDISLTIAAFAKHFGVSSSALEAFLNEQGLWHLHEKGKLSDEMLLSGLNAYFLTHLAEPTVSLSAAAFTKSWNTLLLNIPQQRIYLLQKLSSKYRLFLLSNTNATHIVEVNRKLAAENGIRSGLGSLFEKTYYSHDLGMRKPDAEIYEYVLQDKGLAAQETVFIDDNEQNIISASEVGIQTIWVKPPYTILELLANA